MTAHYQIAQHQPRSTGNQKDHHQRDTKQRITSQEMPGLPAPYQQVGDYHWQLWSDDIIATLWYDRLNGLWNVRFDWPSIQDMQFQRDTPAMQIREKIIEAIDNRWSDDDNDWIPF